MQVHDLAKDEWSLFTERNLLMKIAIYDYLLWKFIDNPYYFRKIYFLQVTSLHLKFYKAYIFLECKICLHLY